MSVGVNEKHREVRDWLGAIFHDSIPQYEISTKTIDILHALMKTNLERDKHIEAQIEDCRLKAKEYYAEGQRLTNILDGVGLQQENLSQSGTMSLRTLSNIAELLQIAEANDSSYLCALSDISQQTLKIEEQRSREHQLFTQLSAKTKSAMLRTQSLNKAVEALREQKEHEAPHVSRKSKQLLFFRKKGGEYRKRIETSMQTLHQSGVDTSVLHQALLIKSKELEELKGSLEPLRARMSSYQSLPPDVPLAKVKLEELRREIETLERQLYQNIDTIHLK
ncbi:unnamed protein product [Owenia fusiformis]|uniref:HAUS augmin-like complex subunit 1 n=1 Tax=Owenia fusiformis TaxID=6347 RepID=A0A8S4PXD4_OWEFU|nr:unnamed protein product [Owenia fusiformis]